MRMVKKSRPIFTSLTGDLAPVSQSFGIRTAGLSADALREILIPKTLAPPGDSALTFNLFEDLVLSL